MLSSLRFPAQVLTDSPTQAFLTTIQRSHSLVQDKDKERLQSYVISYLSLFLYTTKNFLCFVVSVALKEALAIILNVEKQSLQAVVNFL